MAGRFRFRLDVVERLRRQARDGQRRVVAEAIRSVRRVEYRIGRLTGELTDTVGGLRDDRTEGRIDVVSLRRDQLYQGHLHRVIRGSQVELDERREELEVERQKLAEASKRLKVIEKLRERHWNRYVDRIRREEQAATDEVALQAYLRERREVTREVSI